MSTRKHSQPTLLLVVSLLALFACTPQEPIYVYITPTPIATAVPTLELKLSETVGAPMATQTMLATPLPLPTFWGAVIGPDYTLQPTETPKATQTTLPTETLVGPTATWTPTETPAGPSPTPLPSLDPARMGIQVDTNMGVPEWGEAMYYVEQTGVGWVKVQANWKFLQPNSPNDFDQSFGLFQLHVQNAKQRGFKVLISVAKAPNWARSNHSEDGPPDNPQLLANFITFLLSKVGDRTDAIEIWNEPNLTREWTGTLPFNGAGYMQLFVPAYNAIRAYSPSIIVVTAGLAPTGSSPYSVDDRTYLQQMYNAGLRNYRDVVIGIHPYSWGNPPDVRCCNAVDGQSWDDDPHFFFSETIDAYRNIMVNAGHGDGQLWATEFGWATWEGLVGSPPDADPWMYYNNLAQQANYTLRAFEIGQSLSFMGPMFLWNLNFANTITVEQRREVAAYSLIIHTSSPPQVRPLYYLLGQATRPR